MRRALKIQQAQQRASKNLNSRRNTYSVGQLSNPSATYQYSPAPTYHAGPLHAPRSSQSVQHTSYIPQRQSVRTRYPAAPEENHREDDWHTPPPSDLSHSKRWSPDNYSDLHTRHPSFAKNLISHSTLDDASLSPREVEITSYWHEEHNEPHSQGHYIQRPNGSAHNRDRYHPYVRKEV
jgi:hypothetical protein